MKDKDWQKIVWIIIKVLFWCVVGSAILMIVAAILGGIGSCLEKNPWVGWVLSIAFWVGVIWFIINKDE